VIKSVREQTWDNFAAGLLAIFLGLFLWSERFPFSGGLLCVAGALLSGNAVYVLVHLRNRHEELR
jgi:hypothetical protein